MNSDQNLITIENISVDFYFQENFLSKKQKIRAVKNVSLNIKKGSFVGLVGESGSGKTTLGRTILAANTISQGKVIFNDGKQQFDLSNISKTELKEYRKKSTTNISRSLRRIKSSYDRPRHHCRTFGSDENNTK